MRRRSILLGSTVLVVLTMSACGASSGAAVSGDPFAAPDRVVGPGEIGRAITFTCAFDRFRFEDPIAHPGHVMGTHLHQFFGARGVHADSSATELSIGETTCDDTVDTAAYWAPTLIDPTGVPVEPIGATVTYRLGPDVAVGEVAPFPPGFMAVAGDELAEDGQPTTLVAWSCGETGERTVAPGDCGSAPLLMHVTFQDCWDGSNNRSPIVLAPAMHVAYSDAGSCPDSHPVHIPQVDLAIELPPLTSGDADDLELSSGDIVTGHAYFWQAWRPDAGATVLMPCLLEGVGCDERRAEPTGP